MTQCFTFIFC